MPSPLSSTEYASIRRMYSTKAAQDSYKLTLYESREGINQTPDRIQAMDDIVSPLIKRDSQYHIFMQRMLMIYSVQNVLYTHI